MHHIQEHILSQLIRHDHRRYADLRPTGVEGNLFMYHLRRVMKDGYVVKRPDGRYELSLQGNRLADNLTVETMVPRLQARIVTLIACDRPDGQWLMFRRKRQPNIGMVGFPYGKVLFGETVAEAAARDLSEKTGLTATLTHRGDGYITMTRDGEMVSQILFHLFCGPDASGELLSDTAAGTAFWADPEALTHGEYLPSFPDLIAQVKSGTDRFWVEKTYEL